MEAFYGEVWETPGQQGPTSIFKHYFVFYFKPNTLVETLGISQTDFSEFHPPLLQSKREMRKPRCYQEQFLCLINS